MLVRNADLDSGSGKRVPHGLPPPPPELCVCVWFLLVYGPVFVYVCMWGCVHGGQRSMTIEINGFLDRPSQIFFEAGSLAEPAADTSGLARVLMLVHQRLHRPSRLPSPAWCW